MKLKVYDLSGEDVSNGPIQIDKNDLLQDSVRIGSLDDEGLGYLIDQRKNLKELRFVDAKYDENKNLVDVNLFVGLLDVNKKLKQSNKFSWIKVIYYGLVILASMISIVYSWMAETPIWIIIFFFAVLFSSTYLLIDYLAQKGVFEKNDK